MKKIDRYILFRYIRNYILFYLVGCLLIVASDFIFNSPLKGVDSDNLTITACVFQYYLYKVFCLFDDYLMGFLLVAGIMTISSMKEKHEIITLFSMGISPCRIIMPIILGAFIFSCFAMWVREVIIPRRLIDIARIENTDSKCKDYIKMKESSYHIKNEDNIRGYEKFLSLLLESGNSVQDLQCTDHRNHIGFQAKKIDMRCEKMFDVVISLGNKELRNEDGGGIIAEYCSKRSAKETSGWRLINISPNIKKEDFSKLEFDNDVAFIETSLTPMNMAVGNTWNRHGAFSDLSKVLTDSTFYSGKYDATVWRIKTHSRFIKFLSDVLPLFWGLPFLFWFDEKNYMAWIIPLLITGVYLIIQLGTPDICGKLVQNWGGDNLKWGRLGIALGVCTPLFLFVPVAVCTMGELSKKNNS